MPEFEGQEPKDKKEFNGFKGLPHADETREFFRRHRVNRILMNSVIRLLFYITLFVTESGREVLKDPTRRGVLFDREQRTGFLEDSIFNPDLYHPNRENTSLEVSSAAAGRYVGYDFRRPREFGLRNRAYERQIMNGRLFVVALDEIKDNDAKVYTPTDLLNIFDINHALCLDFPPLDQVIEQGYLRETTYGTAYERVGLYKQYRLSLIHSGVVDKPVYIVTPKGNSIVGLMRDGGKKVEKTKAIPEFKPVFET